MLSFNLQGNILEVTETQFSFVDTKINYWYYDVLNWTKSQTGKKGEIPSVKMLKADIEWVEKYYIPKVR